MIVTSWSHLNISHLLKLNGKHAVCACVWINTQSWSSSQSQYWVLSVHDLHHNHNIECWVCMCMDQYTITIFITITIILTIVNELHHLLVVCFCGIVVLPILGVVWPRLQHWTFTGVRWYRVRHRRLPGKKNNAITASCENYHTPWEDRVQKLSQSRQALDDHLQTQFLSFSSVESWKMQA